MFDSKQDLLAFSLIAMVALGAGLAVYGGDYLDDSDDSDSVAEVDSDSLQWKNHITVKHNGEVIHEGTNTLTDQGKDFIAGKISEGTTDFQEVTSTDLNGNVSEYVAIGHIANNANKSTSSGVCSDTTTVQTTDDLLCGEFVTSEVETLLGTDVTIEETGTSLIRKQSDTFRGSSTTGTVGVFEVEAVYTYNFQSGSGETGDSVTVDSTGLYFTDYDSTGPGEAGVRSLVSGDVFDTVANLEDGDQLTVTHQITISDGS